MRMLTLLAVAVLVAVLAGCGAKKGFEKEGYAYGCPLGDTKVGSMQDLVDAKVSVEGPRTTVQVVEMRCTMSSDLLRIDATLNNDSRNPKRVAYKLRWIDREGMRAAEEESWKPLMLYEKSNQVITAVAPTPKAVDYKIILMGQE
jgi:uncharacterized protein YcfL